MTTGKAIALTVMGLGNPIRIAASLRQAAAQPKGHRGLSLAVPLSVCPSGWVLSHTFHA